MGVIDFATAVSEVIQAGEVVEGNVVKVIADNGAEIGDAVFKVVQGGNGQASEVGVAVAEGSAGAGTIATGLGYLALDVGVAGAAIAPALGVLAGVGLYNLAPEFWTNVSNALVNAGQTVGGKVIAYWNGDNVNLSAETIEIFKNALIAEGVFNYSLVATPPDGAYEDWNYNNLPLSFNITNDEFIYVNNLGTISHAGLSGGKVGMVFRSSASQYGRFMLYATDQAGVFNSSYTYKNKTVYYTTANNQGLTTPIKPLWTVGRNSDFIDSYYTIHRLYAWSIIYGNITRISDYELQDDAEYPTDDPFNVTYPNWIPWEYPITILDPLVLPIVYPIQFPEIGPTGYPNQDEAQNPNPEIVTEIYPVIINNFDIHIDPEPEPEPEPDPDPDPEPDPDPIEDPDITPTPPDPVDPNPEPDPSPVIPITPLPDTVASNRLFTVYNPAHNQLDALGAYLWDSSIIAQIRDIWQEPLEGVISLIQVYATPPTSGSHNIILGFLDSGVSAPVVSNQFVEINCGSVSVPENKKNATDYAPYTSLHAYLPFIGIVELDTNECMKSIINIKYKVDVYTGTCLATISITRDVDMPNAPILYNYSGNCSQQIPLTSGNATGMLSALIGGITAGLSVASGGGLGVVAGASIAGQSLTHDMFHVNHSSNLSANAGIMGNKKPYLIIGRRHCYDANNYNSLYGFPANKTVILGNENGFVKVKKCFLKTSATQPEHDEIMSLLMSGVIL